MSFAKIRPRRSTKTEWELINPILMEGEMGIEYPDSGIGTGLCKFKLGDGFKDWNELPYAFNAEAAEAIYGGTVTVHHDIWLRTGTTNEWETVNPVLGLGEIVFDITKNAIKIGDGEHNFNSLEYIGGYTGDISNASVTFTATSETDNTTLLNKIVAGTKLNIIVAAVKNLLSNINTTVNNLVTEKNKYKYSNEVSCAVGASTCTINDSAITNNSLIEIFTDSTNGTVVCVNTVTITTGKAVISFDSLEEATKFKLRISNI